MLGMAFLPSACAAPAPTPQLKPERPRAAAPARQQPPALLSYFGDEPTLKVTAVDNVPWEQLPETSLLKAPNGPAGRAGAIGAWIAPGARLVHSQFVQNINGGVSFVQGNVRLTAISGHTYLMRPVISSNRGKVSFSVIDYGANFPQACLPGAISLAKPAGASVRGMRFTHDEITACLRAARTR